jgi:hypothetical protein
VPYMAHVPRVDTTDKNNTILHKKSAGSVSFYARFEAFTVM